MEITNEMIEVVVLAQLYRENPVNRLRAITGKSLKTSEVDALYKSILKLPEFKEMQKSVIQLEELTLIDENPQTIMLNYTKLLKDSMSEGKSEVALRILKEIKQMKAIENEQMKFEVRIVVDKGE